jgi:septal ring factor EnvC (AmiA/AmiB activator)
MWVRTVDEAVVDQNAESLRALDKEIGHVNSELDERTMSAERLRTQIEEARFVVDTAQRALEQFEAENERVAISYVEQHEGSIEKIIESLRRNIRNLNEKKGEAWLIGIRREMNSASSVV